MRRSPFVPYLGVLLVVGIDAAARPRNNLNVDPTNLQVTAAEEVADNRFCPMPTMVCENSTCAFQYHPKGGMVGTLMELRPDALDGTCCGYCLSSMSQKMEPLPHTCTGIIFFPNGSCGLYYGVFDKKAEAKGNGYPTYYRWSAEHYLPQPQLTKADEIYWQSSFPQANDGDAGYTLYSHVYECVATRPHAPCTNGA